MNINSRFKGGEKYKDHPSIKMIDENVSFESCFCFKETRESDIEKEISNLNSKKADTFGNILIKILEDSSNIYYSILQAVREKCPNTGFFLVRIFLYSVRIQKNTDQK